MWTFNQEHDHHEDDNDGPVGGISAETGASSKKRKAQ